MPIRLTDLVAVARAWAASAGLEWHSDPKDEAEQPP
jgi:hypothetical protein